MATTPQSKATPQPAKRQVTYPDAVSSLVAKQPVGLAHQLNEGARKRLTF